MAKDTLSEADIEASKAFTKELKEAGFPIGFAGWLKDSEEEGEPWRFYLATPLYVVDGPRRTVRLLLRFMRLRGPDYGLEPDDIEIGPSIGNQIEMIRSFIKISDSQTAFDDISIATPSGEVAISSPGVFESNPSITDKKVQAMRRIFESKLEKLEFASTSHP